MRIIVVIHPAIDQYKAVLTAGSRVLAAADKYINQSCKSFIPKDGFLLIKDLFYFIIYSA